MKLKSIERAHGSIFIPELGVQMRVRYSRNGKLCKNTLFTLNDGNVIIFGIARCNLDIGDRFTKKRGKILAVERALALQKVVCNSKLSYGSGVFPVANMLSGWCSIYSVKDLLQHFNTIDTKINDARKKKYPPRKRREAV